MLLCFQVNARWEPRRLKGYKMERRVRDSRAFLRRFERKDNNFLYCIITDGAWLWFHYQKKAAVCCVNRSGSPPEEKGRVSNSGGKFILILFYYR